MGTIESLLVHKTIGLIIRHKNEFSEKNFILKHNIITKLIWYNLFLLHSKFKTLKILYSIWTFCVRNIFPNNVTILLFIYSVFLYRYTGFVLYHFKYGPLTNSKIEIHYRLIVGKELTLLFVIFICIVREFYYFRP